MMQKTCPGCGKASGASECMAASVRGLWYRIWGGQDRVFTAECSRCHQPFPLQAERCPSCDLEVGAAPLFNAYARPVTKVLVSLRERADNTSPVEAWLIRFGVFIASVAILGLLVAAAERKFVNGNGNWITAGLSTVVYLGVTLPILTWILPKDIGSKLARCKPLTKLAFFLNYLSSVLAILILTDHWRIRSWLLMAAFILSLLGIWFASRFVLPAWAAAGSILAGKHGEQPSDPAYRGGRREYVRNRFS